ncbi:class II fructose-bisphosphate aldolase [Mycolicibacterium goodii]|uniref:Fructose-bisphosphate aldolase n=1 Tax=Mycolicibacterium goodii TaxID=134601 RepID=A0A0K0X3T0_MYCGD|nr:fructose-bisphosphate aldolase [Mycolicibacterium goodii]
MALIATADLLASAAAENVAVLAFNVITLEHAEGIVEGAERGGVGVALQISENTVNFHGGQLAPLVSACAHIAHASPVPVAIHLDHFQDPALLEAAVSVAAPLGATSVMVDAAHLPYRDNVDRTRSFTETAHRAGLWVEAELGEIGGKDGMISAHAAGARTNPQEAAAFVEQTGVDGLAVAVGSAHAMTTRDAVLDLDLIRELAGTVSVPLVLHGSSGVDDDQLRAAVRAGIRKINVGTALNIAYTGAVRDALAADPSTTDPRKHLTAGRRAIADAVTDLCSVAATPPRVLAAGKSEK